MITIKPTDSRRPFLWPVPRSSGWWADGWFPILFQSVDVFRMARIPTPLKHPMVLANSRIIECNLTVSTRRCGSRVHVNAQNCTKTSSLKLSLLANFKFVTSKSHLRLTLIHFQGSNLVQHFFYPKEKKIHFCLPNVFSPFEDLQPGVPKRKVKGPNDDSARSENLLARIRNP